VGAALLSVACSSRTQGGGSRVSSQNELTIHQIRESGARDALEAVQRLRPLWLKTRNPTTINAPNTILVYENDTRLGGIDALRGYPIDAIAGLKYMTGAEATNVLLGTRAAGVEGAIVISTRK
jgi:hypothetical protein